MPWYVLIGRIGAEGAARRGEHRPAHLEGLEAMDGASRLRYAGPLLDEAQNPAGSVVVFEAADLAEARRIAADEPYAKGGVFEHYEVWETTPVFPRERSE